MNEDAASDFLDFYRRERLPRLAMGGLETAPDGSGFTLATGLQPLQDPLSYSSMMPS